MPGGNPFTAGVAVDGTGNVYVVDSFNRRVRRVAPDGIVATVAGRVEPEGTGALARATLADPQAIVPAAPFTLFAGGTAGVVQALPTGATALTTVAGRYPHEVATGNLARFRDVTFGSVGGVAYDASAGVISSRQPEGSEGGAGSAIAA